MLNNNLYIPTLAAYLGAKVKLVPVLTDLLGRVNVEIYGELFGGMGSTLLNKGRHPVEIYNDYAYQNYAIFHCLASRELSDSLIEKVIHSEYSKEQYQIELEKYQDFQSSLTSLSKLAKDKPEKAGLLDEWKEQHCFEVGVNSLIMTKLSRLGLIRDGAFAGYIDGLEAERYENWKLNLYDYAKRLAGVRTMNRDAIEIIKEFHDEDNAVFLCDSPYTGEERLNSGSDYLVDQDDSPDFQLNYMKAVQFSKSKIIVCGYENALYDQYLNDETGWSKKLIGEQPKSSKNNGMGEMRDTAWEWIWINF